MNAGPARRPSASARTRRGLRGGAPRRVAVLTTTLLLLLAAAACGDSDDGGGGSAGGDVQVFRDPTEPIVVSPGDRFAIELESNPTTGFSWQIAEPYDETVVTFDGEQYEAEDTGRVGSGGFEQLRFVAAGEGTTTVVLEYVQPWDETTPPAQEKSVEVEVG